ncbi:MAG: CARDB domain-containing protein [Candidatus Nanoarchaeia archaeon]
MKITKLLIIVLLMILLVKGVFAAGVAPSTKEIILSKDPFSYSVRIFNEGGQQGTVDLEITGELSQYISLDRESISFKSGQESQDVLVTITPPKDSELIPGEYVARLVVKERSDSGGEIVALVGVSSRIVMTVPGEAANLQAVIFTPNFVKGKQNTFSVEVTNKGNKNAEECRTVVGIYSALNAEIDTLLSEPITIKAGTLERIPISWTPNVLSGNYIAKAKIVCRNAESSAEHTFSVGSPEINVVSFTATDFTLQGISQFTLVAKSEWGETIPGVYANIELFKDNTLLKSSKTESKDVKAQDTVIYDVFLNTKDVAPGNYKIFVKMNYLGKETESVYSALFSADKAIITSLSGKVTGTESSAGAPADEKSSSMSLLIMAIIVVVILNVVLVVYIIKRKKK